MSRVAILFALMTLASCAHERANQAPVANAATTAGSGTTAGNAAPPAASCCCDRAGERSELVSPDACAANHGTCGDDDSNCHGIDEPIP